MSEHELRQLLADAAELAPSTLERPLPQAGRRRPRPALAVAAAVAGVTTVALLASTLSGPRTTSQPVQPAPSTSPVAAPYTGDGVLVVEPLPEAEPSLSREEAELVMVNGSPMPPLPAVTGFASSAARVTFTLGRVVLDPSVAPSDPRFPVPRELPLAWVASYDLGPTNCDPSSVTAYVLAADGSTAYVYRPALSACPLTPAVAASTERAMHLVSVPWVAEPAEGGPGTVVRFTVPGCARSTTMALPDGLLAVAQVPVGAPCDGEREVAVPWKGPVEVHGRLGPFRQTNSNGVVPLLERL